MSTKIIELKDMEGNILLPYAYSASHDSSGNDFGTVYATKTLVNTKADDNSVVHLSGNEVITGVKTLYPSNQTNLILKTDFIDTTISSLEENQYGNFIDSRDKNDVRLARIYTRRDTNGNNAIALQAWDGSTNYTIRVDSAGNTMAPTPTNASDNSIRIATTEWVNSHIDVNPNIVRTTGLQTITDKKTFYGTSNLIYLKSSNIDKTVIAENNTYVYLDFLDKNNERLGVIGAIKAANSNTYGTYLQAGNEASLQLFSNGTNTWTSCIPSDVINSIVTTTGISKGTNGYMKLGNGMIIQWGRGSIGEQKTLDVTLPTAFSNSNYAVIAGQGTASTAGDAEVAVGAQIQSATVIRIYSHYINPNTVTYYWIAFGY